MNLDQHYTEPAEPPQHPVIRITVAYTTRRVLEVWTNFTGEGAEAGLQMRGCGR